MLRQVYKVNQGYTPKASDELELVFGDFIYIEESQFDGSADGWVYGTSWLTGKQEADKCYYEASCQECFACSPI